MKVLSILNFLSEKLPATTYLRLLYYLKHKQFLRLDSPQALNEKIQHLKLNNFEDFHTTIADKLGVRNYVKDKIGEGYLIELYAEHENPQEIDWHSLPAQFVMKSNNGSAQVKVVLDKNQEKKRDLVNLALKWLKFDHSGYTLEKQYKNIEKKILFERLLIDEGGQPPKDFKIHCINGKVEFIQVDMDRFINHSRNFYDTRWNKLPFTWSPWKNGAPKYPNGKDIPAPKNLNKMFKIAEKLSMPFPYSRVDLYNMDGRIYFGEITLHHESGWARFDPKKYDLFYGKKLKWPKK